MVDLEDLLIFGIPILLVGGVLLLAFGSGGWLHPVAWTVTSLDAATEARIRELVKKAAA